MKRYRILQTAIVTAMLGFTSAAPGHATTISKPTGDETALWWKWVVEQPQAGNPEFDTTGADAYKGQRAEWPVYMIAGGFSGYPPFNRSFDVPYGKPLLYPIYNWTYYGWPPNPNGLDQNGNPAPYPGDKPEDALAFVKGQIDLAEEGYKLGTVNLFATVDGVAVPDLLTYRVASGIYGYESPPGSFILDINAGYPETNGLGAGTFWTPAASDGLWLKVSDLAPGLHTLTFGVDAPRPYSGWDGDFHLSVTATINVVPEPASLLLIAPGLLGLLALRRRDCMSAIAQA